MLSRALCACYKDMFARTIIYSQPRFTVVCQQGINRAPHGEGWLMSMAGLISTLIEIPPGYAAVGTWGSAFWELLVVMMTGWGIHLHAY